MSRPPSDPLVGRVLGDFIVRERIGQGGFGVVYRAAQPALAREAVIKVLHREHRHDAQLVERFMREARLASHLEHPYAAHIYAFGVEADGLLWIAMELIRGTPLSELLSAQGPLPVARAAALLEKICEVVHTAHELGIVHRDLKAANVMVVSRAGRLLPKLVDFGIAKPAPALPPQGSARPDRIEGAEPRDTGVAAGGNGAAAGPDRTLRDSEAGAAGASAASLVAAASTEPDPGPPAGATTSGWRASGEWRTEPAQGGGTEVQLTRPGGWLGSPLTMAPEQWVDAAAVGPACDIYALGVLTFQLLRGRCPFEYTSLFRLYEAHAEEPVPALGAGLPPALDAVVRKAMAKRPGDRFTSAVELAVALRAASGLERDPDSVPQLDESLREELLARAPQPLAEAVAALAAARNVHQAREEAGLIVRVAARLLGLWALAGRARVRPGDGPVPEPVGQAIQRLRRGSLEDREWLELARELCRPFAGRPDVHPLPELVAFFFDRVGRPSEAAAELALFCAGRVFGESSGGSEEEVRRSLERALPRLGQLLRALGFLGDYPLVVAQEGRAQRWMGVRRERRESVPIAGAALADGQPALVDAEGRLVLPLWPLAEAAAPAPGAPAELFLLEGRGSRGARRIAMPGGFERQDAAVWTWLGEKVLLSLGEAEDAPGSLRAPYRGLEPFTREDAGLFFGREREAEAFLNRLRAQPLLCVVGPSGAGKSSFVQAGVLPELPARWRPILLRPGSAPFATLLAQLAPLGLELEGTALAPERPPEQAAAALADALHALAARRGETMVVVVDQLEELFTLCLDPAERSRFAEALARAARSADDPVRVVLTLRDDFLARAEQLPALRTRLGQGLQILTAPLEADLERILVEPARRAGYDFEDPELVREMASAVADAPAALPLLSFAAAQLWELRDHHFKQLTRKAYQALGGVGGALAQHAERTLETMAPEAQRLVREVFRRLVTADGTRATLLRTELLEVIGSGERAQTVLEKLVAARLLVASEGEGGADRIEIVHEALLDAWPRLSEWRREDAAGARLRDQLRAAAGQWQQRGRPDGLLWRDEALGEYQLWRPRYPGQLTAAEEAFVRASLAEAARGRRLRRALLGGAFLLLAIVSAALWRLNARANGNLAILYESQGRQLALDGDPLRALPYLAEADRMGLGRPALRFLESRALRHLGIARQLLVGHTTEVLSVVYAPDGSWLATAGEDHTARIWDPASGRLLRTLAGATDRVPWVTPHPGGRFLLATSSDGWARLYEVATGRMVRRFGPGAGEGQTVFSPDGARIATAGEKGEVTVWETASGRQLWQGKQPGSISSVRFSPDGRRLGSGANDKDPKVPREGRIWDAANGRVIATLSGHRSGLRLMAFDPSGRRVLTASLYDRTARVWDAESGRLLATLPETEDLHHAAFSPDALRVATVSDDRTGKIWDAATGRLLLTLFGHTGPVRFVLWSADGQRIVTTSGDGTARLWGARDGRLLATFSGHTDVVWRATFSPDGQSLVTASWDHTARLWDVHNPDLQSTLTGETGFWSVAYSPDGARLYGRADDGELRVWDTASGRPLRAQKLERPEIPFVAVAPDGTRVAVNEAPRVLLLDSASGRVVARLASPDGESKNAVFSADGRRIVTSEGRAARVWDVASGRQLLALQRDGEVNYAAFSPDDRTIVTASEDRTAAIWDAQTGALLRSLRGHSVGVLSAAFSRDGKRIVTASRDRRIKVWDAGTGQLLASLEGHTDEINCAFFSRDGGLLVSGSWDGTAKLWDPDRGQLVASFDLHRAGVHWAVFSPDGTQVATASLDHTLRLWHVAPLVHSAADAQAAVRCRVPYRLSGGRLVPATPDPRACR